MLNLLQQPLLADIEEVLGALVGLIALVLWVIQRIAEATKDIKKQPANERQAIPQAAAAPGGQPPMGQQADPLRNQVEEFLRRAGAQQPNQGPQQPRRPAPVQEIEVLLDDDALAERPRARVPLRQSEPKAAVARSQKPPRKSVSPPKRKSLAERATERAAARAESLSKQVSQLGQRVISEDQQFDTQLKAKFDHTVGTLAGQTLPSSELVPVETSTPAGQIAAMLANPDGVRQAIVLNEILRRPVDRW
jgi:hypothetical protein